VGENSPVESCTIITTDASELAPQVHDRTPVILAAADYDAWLAGEQVPLVPYPANRMTARLRRARESPRRRLQGDRRRFPRLCVTFRSAASPWF